MRKKPWPIIVLALLQFIGPVVSLFLNAALSNLSVGRYLQVLFQGSWVEQITFFGVPVLAGIAIFSVRIWSYPIFLGCLTFSGYMNFMQWQAYPEMIPAWLLVTIYILNILMVSYFLIPQVRRVYFDRRVRWWQTVPRYHFEFEASCERDGESRTIKVENLSLGGMFYTASGEFNVGDHLHIHFPLFGHQYSIKGEVVHLGYSKQGYGVKFNHTPESSKDLKRLIHGLDTLRVPRSPEYSTWDNRLERIREVYIEILTFMRTGQGLIPTLTSPTEQKK